MTVTLPAASTTATVLIVEDDPGIAELERDRLEEVGYSAVVATNSEDALREVGRGGVDLVLLDYRLPGEANGLDFYARVKAAGYDLPVILVTGFGNEATVIQALRVGVRDFVTKSMEYLDYLPEAVGRVLRQVGTERRLAESEARLGGIIETANDAVIVIEADRRVSLFNPAAERMFRCPAATALGRPVTDFIPDELGLPSNSIDASSAFRGSLTHRLQSGTRGVRAGGDEFPLESTVSPGSAVGRKFYTLVVRDVTERKRAEEALTLFRALIDRATDSIEVIDPATGRFLDVNETACLSHGYTRAEYLALSVCDVDPLMASRPWGELMEERRRSGRHIFDSLRRRKDGATFPVEVSLTFVGLDRDYLVAVVRDITEQKRLEEQFRHAQKMEAIGQLAGGVAHDFNNLLTIINGYSDLLLQKIPPSDPDRDLLGEIRAAGERSASLTRQLLMFSRKQVVATRVVNLNALVTDSVKMLRRMIGEDIRLESSLRAVGRIKADPGQLEQVLLNLVVNARDAMPRGGRVTIETNDAVFDEDDIRGHTNGLMGRYVLLAVSDTGCGMPAEVKARLFEPFFTTKELGKGTGLGLAVVHGVVKQAGGHIEVQSEVGVGTTFKVYLPWNDEPVRSGKTESQLRAAPRGTETILLVEDEDAVRALTRHILAASGYKVLEAGDGETALRLAKTYAGPIHLLVTDVIMPGLGGPVLADQFAALHPEARVLYLSGYTDDAVVRHGILHEEVEFLQKPFSPLVLAGKVREVLDRM